VAQRRVTFIPVVAKVMVFSRVLNVG